MQNSRKPPYVPSLSPANVAGKTAEGHPEARQEVIGFLLSKLWAKSVNLRHKNCQNANVELAIKIYVQCKKKEIAHVHCSPTIYTVWFCFNPTLTLSFWLVKWVVVCICVDPVCWIQGFKCRSYSVVLRICFTWNSSDGNQMKMPTGWKICRKPHGFRLFPWTNPAKKASKRSKPKNFSSQLPSGLP